MLFYETDKIKLFNGNNLDVLREFPDNSIDSIVTDPPYGLSFMGKKWDYSVPGVDTWKECLRVLKPGGHLLAFGGTRTYHRLVVNIEDAGFEIRDQIAWVFSSGFPKALDIGKAVDQIEGNEREIVAKMNKCETGLNNGLTVNSGWSGAFDVTQGFSEAEGWKTALKPALEPICLARKPISEKTIAENFIKHGVGGLNIDKCRVPIEQDEKLPEKIERSPKTTGICGAFTDKYGEITWSKHEQGRFPANIIHDGSDDVVDLFPQQKGVIGQQRLTGQKSIFNLSQQSEKQIYKKGISDNGSAARFFYCAKASPKERNLGLSDRNTHPTIKPIKLMSYLCDLITPNNGTVLDPFNGSGSTGIAAVLSGFNYVGIELEQEYCELSKERFDEWIAK